MHNRPIGYLLGHVYGVTSVSSRGDGYYLASNSKDQSLKIWDVRKTSNTADKPTKADFYDYRNRCIG